MKRRLTLSALTTISVPRKVLEQILGLKYQEDKYGMNNRQNECSQDKRFQICLIFCPGSMSGSVHSSQFS